MPILMPLKTPSIGSSSVTSGARFSRCWTVRQQMTQGDVDTVARRSINNPSRKAETSICRRCMYRAIARLRGSDPALLVFRCYYREAMPRVCQSGDQFAKEDAVDPVIISNQKMHMNMAARSEGLCKRGMSVPTLRLADADEEVPRESSGEPLTVADAETLSRTCKLSVLALEMPRSSMEIAAEADSSWILGEQRVLAKVSGHEKAGAQKRSGSKLDSTVSGPVRCAGYWAAAGSVAGCCV